MFDLVDIDSQVFLIGNTTKGIWLYVHEKTPEGVSHGQC